MGETLKIISAKRDWKVGKGFGVHWTKGKLLVQSPELAGISEEDRAEGRDKSRKILSRSQTLNNTTSPHQVTDKCCYHIRKIDPSIFFLKKKRL